MARKKKVEYQLNETWDIQKPSGEDIASILRAADELIDTGGRAMLVKILKGSKDKKLLAHELEKCPSYGYYNNLKMKDIEVIVDWMIRNRYLRIVYNGRLPMIAFTDMGWELYKPIFADELIGEITSLDQFDANELVEGFKTVNREVVILMLDTILEMEIVDAIEFLELWKPKAYKKVAEKIGYVLGRLKRGE